MTNETTMSKANDYYVLMSGLLGLCLGVLLARPKHIPEAIFALMAGLFAALVIAPMVAEICTSLSIYAYTGWLKATPDTSLFSGIVGLSSLLGYQIVLGLKNDFLNWLRRYAGKRLNTTED